MDVFEEVRGSGLMLGLKCKATNADVVAAGYDAIEFTQVHTEVDEAGRPVEGKQVDSSTRAKPIRTPFFSAMLKGRIAPVGQTWPQALQLDSQPAQSAFIAGVHSPSSPCSKPSGCSTWFGQAL